jgi:hypothetical protein|tara:strand:- start:7584 stop:7796 length:213 start_codon:yes stop_codon:yes gene_type:complete
MDKDKKGNVVYTLKISFNPDTDEVDYIAEGMDDEFDFTPINPLNFDRDYTEIVTSEDMEAIRELFDIDID